MLLLLLLLTLTSTMLRLPENGAEALKHVAILTQYFNTYVCAFVGLDNKEYTMHFILIIKPTRCINLTNLFLE